MGFYGNIGYYLVNSWLNGQDDGNKSAEGVINAWMGDTSSGNGKNIIESWMGDTGSGNGKSIIETWMDIHDDTLVNTWLNNNDNGKTIIESWMDSHDDALVNAWLNNNNNGKTIIESWMGSVGEGNGKTIIESWMDSHDDTLVNAWLDKSNNGKNIIESWLNHKDSDTGDTTTRGQDYINDWMGSTDNGKAKTIIETWMGVNDDTLVNAWLDINGSNLVDAWLNYTDSEAGDETSRGEDLIVQWLGTNDGAATAINNWMISDCNESEEKDTNAEYYIGYWLKTPISDGEEIIPRGQSYMNQWLQKQDIGYWATGITLNDELTKVGNVSTESDNPVIATYTELEDSILFYHKPQTEITSGIYGGTENSSTGKISIPQITVDNWGHITKIENKEVDAAPSVAGNIAADENNDDYILCIPQGASYEQVLQLILNNFRILNTKNAITEPGTLSAVAFVDGISPVLG